MSLPERFLKMLFAFYALCVFIVLLIVFMPVYFLIFWLFPEKIYPRYAHNISRLYSQIVMFLLLIRVKIKGRQQIDPNTTYIFICNHRSMLDIPVIALACQNTFRFLSKEELTRIPGIGYVIRKLYISVRRANKEDRVRSLEKMMKSLHENISVCIFPEGTRNRSSEPLLPFRDGAFRLAIESQLPIAVLTIFDTGKRNNPTRPLELSPGVVNAKWDKPFETKGLTIKELPQLKAQIHSLMKDNIEQHERNL